MDNNHSESIEKDKKILRKLWLFLFFFVLLMAFVLYFRLYLGIGDRVRTIVGSIVLVFLIINYILSIIKIKKRIQEKRKDGSL